MFNSKLVSMYKIHENPKCSIHSRTVHFQTNLYNK